MENKKIKILAIDDNRDNLITLKAIISEVIPQSVVYVEESGQGGIESARKNEPDVILLDIIMPGMDGYQVCKTFKSEEHLSETPIIFLTAIKGDKQSRILALEAGGEAFLAKPIDATELKAQILAMVKIKEAAAYKRNEKLHLEELVQKRTEELKSANIAALNLLEDLKTENEIRKQSELDLKKSEEKFSIMFQKAPFSAALSSISDLKLVEVNEQFEIYWGYSSAEAIGKTSSELGLHPDDNERSRLSAIFRASGFIHDTETKMKSKSGELKDVLINNDIVKIGNEQFVLSTVQNITERKKLEFERHKFVMIADSSSEFIGMCDFNLQPIYVNPSGIRMVGLPDMAEACRVKVQDYFFPEDQRFIADEFFPRVLSEGDGVIEIRLRHFQTGEPIWVYYYLFRVCDDKGQPVGWATVSRDITERKNAEEFLKISRERLLLATEGANLGIWNWNIVTGELIWSNQCKVLFGIGLDETMSYQRFSDALHPDDREGTDMAVKDALENHKDYDIDYRSLWPDGSIQWLAAKGRGYYDAMGKAVRMEGIVLDITQRKHAEEEIKKQLDELQRWHQVTLGREGRIQELKKEVNDLLHQLGEPLRYGSTIPENTAGETKV